MLDRALTRGQGPLEAHPRRHVPHDGPAHGVGLVHDRVVDVDGEVGVDLDSDPAPVQLGTDDLPGPFRGGDHLGEGPVLRRSVEAGAVGVDGGPHQAAVLDRPDDLAETGPAPHVPHRGDAVGDVEGRLGPAHVDVGVGQARHEPAPAAVDHLGVPGDRDLPDRSQRLDPPVAHERGVTREDDLPVHGHDPDVDEGDGGRRIRRSGGGVHAPVRSGGIGTARRQNGKEDGEGAEGAHALMIREGEAGLTLGSASPAPGNSSPPGRVLYL